MGKKVVNPVGGKYTIEGKEQKKLELTLDTPNLDDFVVEELTDKDLDDKLPASIPLPIRWFACFSIYKKNRTDPKEYASVKYSFPVRLEKDQRFFVAYNGQYYEKTKEVQDTGQVAMSEGDPATGMFP